MNDKPTYYQTHKGIDPEQIEGFYAMKIAMTIAKAQLDRGENPPINTTAAMVYWFDELIRAATGEEQA